MPVRLKGTSTGNIRKPWFEHPKLCGFLYIDVPLNILQNTSGKMTGARYQAPDTARKGGFPPSNFSAERLHEQSTVRGPHHLKQGKCEALRRPLQLRASSRDPAEKRSALEHLDASIERSSSVVCVVVLNNASGAVDEHLWCCRIHTSRANMAIEEHTTCEPSKLSAPVAI